MLETILDILDKNNIREYIITESKIETVELYFIKKALDMNRNKKVLNYKVKVFNSFFKDGQEFKGDFTVMVYPSMSFDEIDEAINGGYFAASFRTNKAYKLPGGYIGEEVVKESKFKDFSLETAALKMRDALYKNDNFEKGFINSAEIFVHKIEKRIINSRGADAAYVKYEAEGEFITQWIENDDVELYNSFKYEDLEEESLALMVKNAILNTNYRDKAIESPKTGKYDVILSGENVKTIFEYYIDNANTKMIYEKYSTFKIGDNVQGNAIEGDKLNIIITSSKPFGEEGIELIDRVLIEDGQLKAIHGSFRFADYLGITPIGEYDAAIVKGGDTSLDEIFRTGDLHIIKFSEFQMDSYTGDFFGEITLALLKDGENIIPLTGGSLCANIKDVQGNLCLSKEMQSYGAFKLPSAIKLKSVQISGH
jgi:predicted Zn-dependent protease